MAAKIIEAEYRVTHIDTVLGDQAHRGVALSTKC